MKTIKMIIVVSETQHSKVYFVYIICSANFPFLTNKVSFYNEPTKYGNSETTAGINSNCFLIFRIPCNHKLVTFFPKSLN